MLKITVKGHHTVGLHVWTKEPDWLRGEYSLMTEAADQNRLRYKFGILSRLEKGHIWHDIAIVWHEDKKLFRVWLYTRNWKERAAYYSGMLYAYEKTHRKKGKKKRQTV